MWENIQRRIEGLLSEEGVRLRGEPGSTSGILWSKDDAYARVFGPERPGRVHGVGFGITPSGRSVTNASKFTLTPSSSTRTTQRFLEWENNNALIREQLAQVQDQLAQSEARHQEQQQQAEARHQQKLDACLTRMNAMFAQLSSGTPYSDPSQVPNKCYLAKHIELACNALLCDINTMPLIYSGWQCLMGTLLVHK